MKEKIGEVFSVAKDNAPILGCTVSREVMAGTSYYSLAEDTDISAEMYPYHKLLLVSSGEITVYGTDFSFDVREGDAVIAPTDVPVGVRTEGGAVYTEITTERESYMNKAVKIGEVFKLASLVPYQEGKIVNMDVVHNDKMKFVIMAFDAGTGLSEHAAPDEAIVFALDGEAVIGYEGVMHKVKAGECFSFAKGGKHFVKATGRFKMALLLTLE